MIKYHVKNNNNKETMQPTLWNRFKCLKIVNIENENEQSDKWIMISFMYFVCQVLFTASCLYAVIPCEVTGKNLGI